MHTTAELYREGRSDQAREDALANLPYATPGMIELQGATLIDESDDAVCVRLPGQSTDGFWLPRNQVGVLLGDDMRHAIFARRTWLDSQRLDQASEG